MRSTICAHAGLLSQLSGTNHRPRPNSYRRFVALEEAGTHEPGGAFVPQRPPAVRRPVVLVDGPALESRHGSLPGVD